MRPRFLSTLAALLVLGAASVAANPSERTAVWEWTDVPKVVAIGDLHGSYDKLVQLLEGAELVDEGLRWAGGEAGCFPPGLNFVPRIESFAPG